MTLTLILSQIVLQLLTELLLQFILIFWMHILFLLIILKVSYCQASQNLLN